MKIFQNSGRHT